MVDLRSMALWAIPPYALYHVPTDPAGVAEAPAPVPRDIPEKLLCCLWFDATWRPSQLGTLDGRSVTVLSPGQWNRQAGPDFRQAVIAFDGGGRCVGGGGIHPLASGWTADRHQPRRAYQPGELPFVFRK